MTGSQRKDSKGRRDGTFSSLLSAVRAHSGEGAGLRKSGSAVTAGPQKWQGKMQEPQVQGPQGTRSGYLHPRVHEGGHAFFGSKAVPEKLPDMDNEGRPFNLKLVVVNFNNVGTHFGKMFKKRERHAFDWEGVRRCVKELTKSKYKVIGVIYQNWEAWDGDEWCQGIPEDIRSLCESIQETPKIALKNQRSADDEMTIKCAYHRNCCILDNDNYKDWLHLLRKDEIREWYQFSRGRIHMKYFFDSEVGFFETLDGNAVRGASEEREEREEKRKSRNRSRARVEEEARNQRYSEDAWSAPSGIDNTPPETAESSMLSDPAPMMVPTETGFRKHKGPTITMPTSMARSASAPNTVDLTAEPRRSPASKDINGITAGWTALCTAAQQSKVQSVGRLLEAKADPNVPNCMGAHPLFYALCNWSLRMFRLLEKHGANPEKARSEKGESLKAYAERKVGQAAEMKRFGAAYFASASRQELLRAVGARKAARNALTAVAAAESERAKRRRVADRADPGRVDDGSVRGRAMRRTQASKAASTRPSSGIPALQDPYGGLNKSNSIDLTETDWDVDMEGLPAQVLDAHEEDGTGDEVGEIPGDSGDVDDQELAALLGAALEEESVMEPEESLPTE